LEFANRSWGDLVLLRGAHKCHAMFLPRVYRG
jgi:hypothetical protein